MFQVRSAEFVSLLNGYKPNWIIDKRLASIPGICRTDIPGDILFYKYDIIHDRVFQY